MSLLAGMALLGALNLGFEEWGEGRAVGWTRGDDGRLTSDCEEAEEGRCAAKLIRGAGARGEAMILSQQIAAHEARGQTVNLSGYVRILDLKRGVAGLWMRVEGGGRVLASSRNVVSGRGTETEWQPLDLDVHVDPGAERITFGAILSGRGEASFDDLSLSVR